MRGPKVTQPVTTLRRSPKEDRDQRMRSYVIAMSIRTLSFPLAVWALLSGWIVVGLLLALAATFLPQVAVMLANAVDHRSGPVGAVASPTRALPPGGADPHDAAQPPPPHTPHTPRAESGPDAGL